MFKIHKEYPNGGKVLIHKTINKKGSDYKPLVNIANLFAKEGRTVMLMPTLHYKSEEYKEFFSSLIDTIYERKCPDLQIDGIFYEFEDYSPPFKRRKISNMISHGAKQSPRIIINNTKGASDRYIRRQILERLEDKNFKYGIDKVWLYEKGKMTNNKTIFQVDAFTDEPFKGNPAGVMIVTEEATSDWMQNIAFEMNLSETAFIIPGKDRFRIRYFTPAVEVPLCGHATLASSHIIYELGLKSAHETIEFEAKGADLTVRKENDWIIMNFPEYPVQKIDIHKDFKRSLGFEAVEMYSSSYDWIIAVAESEKEILNAEPDFELMKKNGLGHLIITSICDSKQADFVVRCFAPVKGINEDPVTGSAHCALTPLWANKLNKVELDSLQLSKRTGRLKVKLNNDRVEIKGKALTVFEAEMKI